MSDYDFAEPAGPFSDLKDHVEAFIAEMCINSRRATAQAQSRRIPKLGSIVIYRMSDAECRRDEPREHPALVTRVHGPNVVNLAVFIDSVGISAVRRGVERMKDSEPERAGWYWGE